MLGLGEPAPWFRGAALSGAPSFAFHTVAGRHVLLLFFGSARLPEAACALAETMRHRALFDDRHACFFGITIDPTDGDDGRIVQELPGIRYFLDYDGRISALYGAGDAAAYSPHWLLLDPALRVLANFPLDQGTAAIAALRDAVAKPAEEAPAPVLRLTNVLEPDLCRDLVRRYHANGGEESGFMSEVDGKTVLVHDAGHKRRRDWVIDDPALVDALLARLRRRMSVSIERAFQFRPTRIERHIVACYAAGHGHFRAHRDNTTKGTAHRRFAVTINLNDDYDGGDLRFPEFGMRTYRAPVGGAVIFSCSLLHEATPVTSGRRFAYLPFLYDEDAARVREANVAFLDQPSGYTAG